MEKRRMSLIKTMVKQSDGTYKPSDSWYYQFNYKGQTYRKSTGTSNKTLAAKVEAKAHREAVEGVTLGKKKSLTTKQAFQCSQLHRWCDEDCMQARKDQGLHVPHAASHRRKPDRSER
jgi:hypothetical protein